VALARVVAGRVSAIVVVLVVVVMVVAVDSVVTATANTTADVVGALVTRTVDGDVVDSAAERGWEWLIRWAATSAGTINAMMIAGWRQMGRVEGATAMARWLVQPWPSK
jgi:hypothetical protein